MTISVIRRYTDEDAIAIEKVADRFCKRHAIENDPEFIGEVNIESHIYAVSQSDPQEGSRLARLWQRCYCRAFDLPYDSRLTVFAGHIGYRID